MSRWPQHAGLSAERRLQRTQRQLVLRISSQLSSLTSQPGSINNTCAQLVRAMCMLHTMHTGSATAGSCSWYSWHPTCWPNLTAVLLLLLLLLLPQHITGLPSHHARDHQQQTVPPATYSYRGPMLGLLLGSGEAHRPCQLHTPDAHARRTRQTQTQQSPGSLSGRSSTT